MRKPKPVKPPAMSEKDWSKQFKHLFEVMGWQGFHPYLSIYSDRGWPDWSLVNPTTGRLIFVELKTEAGKLSDSQIKWRDLLQSAGQEWYCFRPSQFDDAASVLGRNAPAPGAREE